MEACFGTERRSPSLCPPIPCLLWETDIEKELLGIPNITVSIPSEDDARPLPPLSSGPGIEIGQGGLADGAFD